MKLLLINEPEGYFDLMEVNVRNQVCKKNDAPDIVHLFAKSEKEFESEMKKLKNIYNKKTSVIIGVSWYKKAAKISTDVTEDVIRNYALKMI